jgi:hypothetical protein
VRKRGTERRGTAGGDGREEGARRRIRNLLMGPILPEGQIVRTGMKRIQRRVRRWIIGMMRNSSRVTLRALTKMKSPQYLRTRIAIDK